MVLPDFPQDLEMVCLSDAGAEFRRGRCSIDTAFFHRCVSHSGGILQYGCAGFPRGKNRDEIQSALCSLLFSAHQSGSFVWYFALVDRKEVRQVEIRSEYPLKMLNAFCLNCLRWVFSILFLNTCKIFYLKSQELKAPISIP